MIKIGFKLFGLLTVIVFFPLVGAIMAARTSPPQYKIKTEVLDIIYPTAREHVLGKFSRFLSDI
ncbi:MAG TPA: hypothetical protein PLQ76_03910, partial [bacterium]|nr:hypothetical protein [bacterium]